MAAEEKLGKAGSQDSSQGQEVLNILGEQFDLV